MTIIEAKPEKNFRLFLRFDDGVSGVVDLSHMTGCGVFEAWNRDGVFEKVRITKFGAVEWPGEIDLCPDALYLQLTNKKPQDVFPALREGAAHA